MLFFETNRFGIIRSRIVNDGVMRPNMETMSIGKCVMSNVGRLSD